MTAVNTAPAVPEHHRLSPAAWIAAKLIRGYQYLMAWSQPHCRFAPTCSQYALEALATHGAARGSWLAVRRVGRCHPFHDGGLDPVPPASPRANTRSSLAAPVGVAEEG